MVGYAELLKLNTFTLKDVCSLVGNKKTASSMLLRLSKKGYVKKIRNNLYTCVNLADGKVVASKYHIACSINETAYISHHSAFEYIGISNHEFTEIYVSSSKRFSDFEFEGITYKYVPSKFDSGVVYPKDTKRIRITLLERTVIDSIKDFEETGGLGELLNCINSITHLDEYQLIKFLSLYNVQFLYQKTGFILEQYKDQLHLSNDFINFCKSKIGKSTRYLTKDSTKYNKKWKLVVPEDVFHEDVLQEKDKRNIPVELL